MSPKLAKKLADKKYRTETGLFLVEGEKNIRELLESDFYIEAIYGTPLFLDIIATPIRLYEKTQGTHSIPLAEMDEEEVVKIGTRESNNAGIAVVKQKPEIDAKELIEDAKKNFVLALSDVRDPGNLGTIIRIADWFGVTYIALSPTTTDFYNPKTIAATMGSFTRVKVAYLDLSSLLKDAGVPVIGADLVGKNIHEGGLPSHGILVMGSESHGIEDALSPLITEKVTIPKYGDAESLNVSVATGIILDVLRKG